MKTRAQKIVETSDMIERLIEDNLWLEGKIDEKSISRYEANNRRISNLSSMLENMKKLQK